METKYIPGFLTHVYSDLCSEEDRYQICYTNLVWRGVTAPQFEGGGGKEGFPAHPSPYTLSKQPQHITDSYESVSPLHTLGDFSPLFPAK